MIVVEAERAFVWRSPGLAFKLTFRLLILLATEEPEELRLHLHSISLDLLASFRRSTTLDERVLSVQPDRLKGVRRKGRVREDLRKTSGFRLAGGKRERELVSDDLISAGREKARSKGIRTPLRVSASH
jgi:hypothetical protein